MSSKLFKHLLLMAFAALIVACTPTSVPTNSESPDDVELPSAPVLAAQEWLAEQLGVPIEEIAIESEEQVDWQDSCLGLGGPAESCLMAITPGWRAIFTVDGMQYEVRTDANGEGFRSPELPG